MNSGSAPIRTPDYRLRAFVSSTLQELAAERGAARSAIEHLRLVPVMFELGARPHPPRDLYVAYLEQSHVFLGIYWERYGWVAEGMEISGLEDEYVLAANHPKLVYVKSPAPQREERLEQLLGRIRDDAEVSYRSFSTADELRELVENDLAVLLTERFEATLSAPPEDVAVGVSIQTGALSAKKAAGDGEHPGELPPEPNSMVGRDVEVADVVDLLGDARLVTITGVGGSGKTRLAMRAGLTMRDEHGKRVSFVDLSGLQDAELVLPSIAAAVGVRDATERDLIDTLATVLGDTERVLVVDNFEHVLKASEVVSRLLAATTGVRVLVTSREPLHLQWEYEYPLEPLALPEPGLETAVGAMGSPAVDLFVQRARQVRPNFALSDANAPVVAEMCRRLDGLPLALELAAAQIRVMSPADLARRLTKTLDTLDRGATDAPTRHQTLREAIDWSHNMLSDVERLVFRRLGAFGDFGLEAAEIVCRDDEVDDVFRTVADLVDRSLVVRHSDPAEVSSRYSLLQTVQEYARERLAEAGEEDRVRARHLAWCVDLTANAAADMWGPSMPQWLDVIDKDLDNIRSALDFATSAGLIDEALSITASLRLFWDVRGHYREGANRIRGLLELAGDDPEPSAHLGRSYGTLGWLTALMGDFEPALEYMRKGSATLRQVDAKVELGWSLVEEGLVAWDLEYSDEAERCYEESLAIAHEYGLTYLEGWNIFGLAHVKLQRGDLEGAREGLEAALALTRKMYEPWGIAWALFSRAVMSVFVSDLEGASRDIVGSLDLRWSLGDTRGTADCLGVLAYLATEAGELEWSARLHGAAEIAREANGLTILPWLRPLHEESIGKLHEALGVPVTAQLMAQGREVPIEKVVAEALADAPAESLA